MHVKPSLQALWLVDKVERAPDTGKVNVTGMFNAINVEEPSREFTAPAFLFFALRGVHGPITLSFRFVDLEDQSVLIDRSLPLTHDDPLTPLDVILPLRHMPVPHAGVYVWELVWENEVIDSLRLTASIT